MTSLSDNEKVILIDYEYAGWNPYAYDIANYLDSCMLDHTYSKGVGIKNYYSNFPTAPEREILYKTYLEHYFSNYMSDAKKAEHASFEAFWDATKE